jgi:type II secretory pathway component PulJ
VNRRRPVLNRPLRPAFAGRSGFTLVEMLVSTALVMLIMVLFAQIYGAAVGTLREQEGIAKNDQKARAVITMLRNDLGARSYREIPLAVSDPNKSDLVARGLVPIHPRCLTVEDSQYGFFYISENDPGDDSDDVLSFTMFLQTDVGHYTGRVQKDTATLPNHPDSDDAVQGDGVTASRAAIVTYYLRDGRLHRRINLLRDPLVIPNPYDTGDANAGALLWMPLQPSDEAAVNQLGLGNILYPAADYPTWYQQNALARMENPPTSRLRLLSVKSLENTHRHANAPVALPRSREGHSAPDGNPTGEYQAMEFIGRTALAGSREGEDIVLTNVVGFDVKVWELQDANANRSSDSFEGGQRGGRFVDLGHGALTDGSVKGPFGDSAPSLNSSWGKNTVGNYGPGGPAGNRVFDTWHPMAPAGDFPGNPPSITGPPPTSPEAIAPPFYPLKIPPNATDGVGNQTAILTWTSGGSVPFTSTTDWTINGVYFPWAFRGDYSIAYRVAQAPMGGGTTGALEPVWGRIPGDRVADGNVVWECFDNRIGLTGMRITVRFLDPGTSLIRQVTLDHSFLD